jgi:uncharacterized protein YndB with AHSA1/START domain
MNQSEGQLVLVMQRVFKTDPETLFDAWTKPELMKQWFHAKENWTTPVAEADLKPGGAWKVDMQREDGHVHHALGHYREIDRPNKLVFIWHPFGDTSVETVVTLRFKRLSEKETELTLTHEGLRNEKEKADHTGGWTGCLGCLGIFSESREGKK